MKRFTLISGLLFSIGLYGQRVHPVEPTDKIATHGMLIFGREKIYLSHLPMFHSGPHNYQIVLEVLLDKPSQRNFIFDQQQHPEFTTYTISPERFVLPEMLNHPRLFKAALYRGHFERGGVRIADSVGISILQVVYFKKLNSDERKAESADFILFGNSKEQFLAHRITNKPDFDQIIEVMAEPQLTKSIDEKFRIITLDKTVNNPVGVSGNDVSFLFNGRKLVLLKQLYLEFDDLK